MITLAIETSCDETALCLLETRGEYPTLEYRVLAHVIHSQVDIHSKYGGVFPMMAKREHAKRLVPLLEQAIAESGIGTESFEAGAADLENARKICGPHDENLFETMARSSLAKEKPAVDRIAVTHGPGLEPALWVGVNFASALGALWNVPVEGVNHMEGHIAASLIEKTDNKHAFEKMEGCPFPAIAFLMSGGHTEIVLVKELGDYAILGATRDDAIGEAFDKVARMLGLPYPGGPEISRLAEEARKEETAATIKLPRPMIGSETLDMSFSGLKTAVLYELKKHPEMTADLKKEISREFEDAVTDVVIAKVKRAFDGHEARTFILGGGVAANAHIRAACAKFAASRGVPFFPPAPGLSGDNALMIALSSAITRPFHQKNRESAKGPLQARGNLSLT